MRITLCAAVAALSVNAHAGIFDLDDSQYWQVQVSITYVTVCEGFISACEVADGVAHTVINHTTGQRLMNQIAAPANTPGRVSCEDTEFPQALLTEGLQFWEGQPSLECTLTCPANTILITTSCNAIFSLSPSADIDPQSINNSLATNLSVNDGNTATCQLFGQYEQYYLESIPEFYPTRLDASAMCLPLN